MVVVGRGAFLAALGMTLAFGASAQTAEQIRQFQQLSPEQRAAAVKAAQEAASGQGAAAAVVPAAEPVVVVPAPVQPAGPSAIEERYAGRTDAASLAETGIERAFRQELKQFGYDLFAGVPTTFAPATDIPVPADYVIGPGDTIEVQLFGKENQQYNLVVTRDGRINFPEFGAIPVAGLPFSDLRADLEKRVAEQMIGVKAAISMGALRSIRVFVLGDVTRPGSYTVSGLSTMTNALFVSGGIRPIGSLRNVQLKRNGRVVARLDLYDLLLNGDTSDDVRLQPGDAIFVPPIGPTAGVAGEVRRPAIYELRGETRVARLVDIAGGLLPTAAPRMSQLERLVARGNQTLVDVNLDDPAAAQAAVADGDVLRVYANLDRMDGVVLLAGHVRRPGGVAWHDRMRLTDLVGAPEQLLPRADLEYVLVRREERPLGKVRAFSTRLSAAWADPQSDADVLLEPRDQVFVFAQAGPPRSKAIAVPAAVTMTAPPASAMPAAAPTAAPVDQAGAADPAAAGAPPAQPDVPPSLPQPAADAVEPAPAPSAVVTRRELLEPLLEDLAVQADMGEPTRIVSVDGLVRESGRYPLEANMRVSDLLRAAGGLSEAAYTLGAEVTRYSIVEAQKREVSHVPVDLARVLEGDAVSDVLLQPHDSLNIKRLPDWADQLLVEVRGEVRFPGSYPIKPGERLSDVLERAGGPTDLAFAAGAVFTREELRLKEEERIKALSQQLEADIAAASLQASQDPKQADALASARALLPQLKSARATGRLVIDLDDLLERGKRSRYDVALKSGDVLTIPTATDEVTVIGEVQYPTSHVAQSGFDADDYINRSGGLTYKADEDRVYVIRANGRVEPTRTVFFFWNNYADVEPGDTVVVPLDVERMRPLTFWASVTQILYQIALTAAAANAVGAF